jgi:hypothetical protein
LDNLQTNIWNHIALVITTIPDWHLYFNGDLVRLSIQEECCYPPNIIRDSNFIGKNNNEEYSSGTFIDDFRIYRKIFDSSNISDLM